MGQTAKELRALWRKRYTELLDSIFKECASHELTIGPYDALDLMEECLKRLAFDGKQSNLHETRPGSRSNLRFDFVAYRREAHHYAVEQFYKTYFPRKRGAPMLPTAHIDRILALRFKGLNYVAIAERLGQPKDRVRKQVEAAEKRWREAVERIEQLKERFPHLVARVPPAQVRTQRKSEWQSERQKVKERTGK
jgi:hypothetical protein